MNRDTKPMILLGDAEGMPLTVRLSVVEDERNGHDLTLVADTSGGITGLKDEVIMKLDPHLWPDGVPDELVLACWGACDS